MVREFLKFTMALALCPHDFWHIAVRSTPPWRQARPSMVRRSHPVGRWGHGHASISPQNPSSPHRPHVYLALALRHIFSRDTKREAVLRTPAAGSSGPSAFRPFCPVRPFCGLSAQFDLALHTHPTRPKIRRLRCPRFRLPSALARAGIIPCVVSRAFPPAIPGVFGCRHMQLVRWRYVGSSVVWLSVVISVIFVMLRPPKIGKARPGTLHPELTFGSRGVTL